MALNTARGELKASYAFVERNFNLTRRYWGWEMAWLIYSVAGALAVSLIGFVEGSELLLLTIVVGAIFWNYLSIVFGFIGETVTWERWEGTLEYTFMAPIRRYTQLVGSTLYAVAYGLVHTAVILVVLILVFQIDLAQGNFLTAVIFMLIGSVSFVGIGMMAAILPLLYVERGDQMVFVIQSVLLLFSGVYYEVRHLPDWMQFIAQFSPATYVIDGVRQGLIHNQPITALLDHVWPLVVMGIIFVPLGLWVFGRAEAYAKRTGKLKRVG